MRTELSRSFLLHGACRRVYHYIENSVSKDSVDNEEIIYQAGKVIGEFFNTFKRFKAKNLFEVIKDLGVGVSYDS